MGTNLHWEIIQAEVAQNNYPNTTEKKGVEKYSNFSRQSVTPLYNLPWTNLYLFLFIFPTLCWQDKEQNLGDVGFKNNF